MSQGMGGFTERIYKKFLEKLQGDEEIPTSLTDEVEKLLADGQLTDSEAILEAYEKQEEDYAKDR
jgi:hypothetical protein